MQVLSKRHALIKYLMAMIHVYLLIYVTYVHVSNISTYSVHSVVNYLILTLAIPALAAALHFEESSAASCLHCRYHVLNLESG